MPDDATQPAEQEASPRELAEDFLRNVELQDIRPTRVASALADGATPGDEIQTVSIEVAVGHLIEEGVYSNRFDFRLTVLGADGREIATIEFDLVLDYAVAEQYLADPRAAEYVATTTGYFAAYPYARELVQRMATALRLPPITLGLMKRDENGKIEPAGITVVRPRADVPD